MANGLAGRPTKYTQKLADEICTRLAEGEPFVKICRDDHMPAFSTLWRWERAHPEFKAQTQMALEHGTHYLASDCLRICDDTEMDVPNRKLMVETRMRLIGKWNRKGYGDKIEVEETKKLEDFPEGEIRDALQRKLKELHAQGIDVRAMVDHLP